MINNFNVGDIAINAYGQEVEISDIDDDVVVFIDINNDSVDTLRAEEFKLIFKPVKEKAEIKEPSRREFRRMIS